MDESPLFSGRQALALLLGALLVLALVATPSAAAPKQGKRPVVGKILPKKVERGARLVVRGRHFVRGKRRNLVVFLGGRGRRDNVRVRRTLARGRGKLVLRAPFARIRRGGRGAMSGRVMVINRLGRSRPSRAVIRFDDDGDGVPNEREIAQGTNPRNPDSDGDGVTDGRDPLPTIPGLLSPAPPPPPPSSPPPSSDPSEDDDEPEATSYDCNDRGPAIGGAGLTSTFEGLVNVSGEGRARIGHGAYSAGDFVRLCLLRKQRGEPDSTYQLVGSSPSAAAGVIQDGERVLGKGNDFLFRTDVVTTNGHVPGANELPSRSALSVANVDGWAQLEANCAKCGSSSVQAGALRSSIDSDGLEGAGETVGAVAVYRDPIALGWDPDPEEDPTRWGTEVSTRVLVPIRPSETEAYVAAQVIISVDHPAAVRDEGAEPEAVADFRASTKPWLSIELRTYANGEVKVVARDSAASGDHVVAESEDLSTAGLQNVYLTAQMTGPDSYEVRYKPNTQEPDEDLILDLDPDAGTDRALPGGMPEAWLSLVNETSRSELAEHDVRFDDVNAVWQPDERDAPQESFGGISTNVQLPPDFDAFAVAEGLFAPTAIEYAPHGDLYIALRDGKVMRLSYEAPEGPEALGALEEVLDITDLVNSGEFDHGLLGFALDPEFAVNGFFYVYYTVQVPDTAEGRTVSRVERFKVDPISTVADREDPAREVLVGGDEVEAGEGDTCPPGPTSDCLPSDSFTHSAGGLQFGSDGMLWISTPDGASPQGADPLALRSVHPDSLAGKILRVDPATGDGVPGNPNYDSEAKASPGSRIWAMGFRNPFRIAERPDAPGSWYVADVGWGAWEEVDRMPGAATPSVVPNYGWPCYEGPEETIYKGLYPAECGFSSPQQPLHAYDSTGVDHAVIGGAFYTGGAFPPPWKPAAGQASYFYADYPSGEITRVLTNASDEVLNVQAFGNGFPGPVMVTEGPADRSELAGETALYLVDLGPIDEPGGTIWRIVYNAP